MNSSKISGEHHCNILIGCKHSLKGYCTNKISWLWPSLKGRKGHKNVNIKLIWDIDVENIPVVSKGSKHFLKCDHTNKVTLTQYGRSQRWPKCQHWTNMKYRCRKYLCRVLTGSNYTWESYWAVTVVWHGASNFKKVTKCQC